MAAYLSMLGTVVFLASIMATGIAYSAGHGQVGNYDLRKQVFEENNPALLIRVGGIFLALCIAAVGAYNPYGELEDFARAFIALAGSATALVIAFPINDHFIVSGVNNTDAIVKERNCGIAIIEVATNVATAFIFARCISSSGDLTTLTKAGWALNIAWFVIGQALLIGLVRVYARLFPRLYDAAVGGTIACAALLAGVIVAVGFAVGSAVDGGFKGWYEDIVAVLEAIVISLALMTLIWGGMIYLAGSWTRFCKELVEENDIVKGIIAGGIPAALTFAFLSIHNV